MIYTSTELFNAFAEDTRQIMVRVKINGAVFDNDNISTLNLEYGSMDGANFSLGSTFASSLKITFAELVEGLAELDEIEVEMGAVLPNGTVEYVPMGTFVINEEVMMDRNNNTTSIDAMDRMVMLGEIYEPTLEGDYARIIDIAVDIANQAGVVVSSDFDRLRTDSILIPREKTLREAIGIIAQFEVGFATFNRDGELTIRGLKDASFHVSPEEYTMKGLVKNEVPFKLNGVQCQIGDSEEDVLQTGASTGTQIVLNNPSMTQAHLDRIYTELNTLNYYPFTLDWYGHPALEAGDWIEIEDLQGNKFKTPNLHYTLDFNGGLKAKSQAETTSSSEVVYQYKSPLKQEIQAIAARLSASGGNHVYDDLTEPTNPKEGDLWFKPEGPDTLILKYTRLEDGTLDWVEELNTGDTTKNADAIAEQQQEIEEAKQQAKLDAEQALEDAKAHAQSEDARIRGELESEIGGAIEVAEQAKADAVTKANQALEDAKAHADAEVQASKEHFDGLIEVVETDVTNAQATADEAVNEINTAITNAGFTSLDETISNVQNIGNVAYNNATRAWNHAQGAITEANNAYELAETSISEAQTAQTNSLTALGKADNALDGVSSLNVRVDDVEAELELKADNAFMTEDGELTTLSNAITFNAHRFRSDMSRIESRVESLAGEINQVILKDAHVGKAIRETDIYPNPTEDITDRDTMRSLIEVSPNEQLAFSKKAGSGWVRIHQYDENYSNIQYLYFQDVERLVTTLPNAKYIWISYPRGSQPQLIRGTDFLPYRPNIVDQMTSDEVVLFRNEYDEFADKTERRLTAVDSSGGRLDIAENLITQTANGLTLKADQSTVDTLSDTVSSLGTEFDVVAGQVSSRVWKSDIDDAIDKTGVTLDDKTKILSGTEIYTSKADDSVVHVEVDGKSSQHAGSGKNLFNKDYIENAYIRGSDGSIVSGGGSYISGFISVKNNVTYTTSEAVQAVGFYDSDKNYIERRTTVPLTFETTDNTGFIVLQWVSGNIDLDTFQLEEGSTSTAYELPAPTPDRPIEIHSLNDFDVMSSVGGRNLVENSQLIEHRYDTNQFLFIPRETGSYTISFDYEILEENEPITRFLLYSYGSNTSFARVPLKTSEDRTNLTFEVTEEMLGEGIHLYAGQDAPVSMNNNVDFIEVKVEKGNVATDWTPAPEDITENDNHPLIDKINLLLSEPLRSVDDVKDRLFRDSDELWKIERNLAEYVSNGSENWEESPYNVNRWDTTNSPLSISAVNSAPYNAKSSHFINGVPSEGEANRTWLLGRDIRVIYGDSNTTAAQVKSYMKQQHDNGTPVTWVYEVRTPTIETLGQELQDKLNDLRSFRDSNYVYTVLSENLKPTLHATFKGGGWYERWKTRERMQYIESEWTQTFDTFSQTVSGIDGRVTEQKQTIEGLETTIQATQSDLSGAMTLLNQTKETVDGRTSVLAELRTDVDGKVTTTKFNTLENTVDGSLQRIGDAEGNITQIEENVDGLQTTVADKASQSEVTQLANGLSSVVTDLSNLEVGGRNVLKGTKDLKTANFDRRANVEIRQDEEIPYLRSNGVSSDYYIVELEPNATYTLSLDIRNFVSGNGSVLLQWFSSLSSTRTSYEYANIPNANITSEWKRFNVTFTVPANDNFLSLGFRMADFRLFKLEKGNMATDWTPAPEDTQSQISQLADNINLRVTKEGLLSQINIEAERTLIQSDRLVLDANSVVFTGSAFIPSAQIESLHADKINAGTIDTARLDASDIVTKGLTANVIKSTHIETSTATIDKLFADEAMINRLTAKTAFINSIKAVEIDASKITSGTINTARLNAKLIVTEGLEADVIKSTHILADTALFDKLFTSDLATDRLSAQTAWIKNGMFANASIDGAVIQDATIGSAQIAELDVGKISGETSNFVKSAWNSINSRADMDANRLKFTHADGSSTQIGINGLERVESGTTRPYQYRTHVGSITSKGDMLSGLNTIKLPSDFIGKNFNVIISFRGYRTDTSLDNLHQLMAVHIGEPTVDKGKGEFRFTASLTTYQYGFASVATIPSGAATIMKLDFSNLLGKGFLIDLSYVATY